MEKPADYDEGDWETVPTKADKKKKVEQPLVKKEKKAKQQPDSEVNVKEETPEKEEEKPAVEEV